MENDNKHSCDKKCPQFILYKKSVKKTILDSKLSQSCGIDIMNEYVDELVEDIFDNLI